MRRVIEKKRNITQVDIYTHTDRQITHTLHHSFVCTMSGILVTYIYITMVMSWTIT